MTQDVSPSCEHSKLAGGGWVDGEGHVTSFSQQDLNFHSCCITFACNLFGQNLGTWPILTQKKKKGWKMCFLEDSSVSAKEFIFITEGATGHCGIFSSPLHLHL
jgi:hypothetical protein